MAVENLIAVGATPADPRLSHGMGGDVKSFTRTIEVSAAASATSTYTFGYVPSNARILGISRVSWDDLASSGSPTLDLGLYPVDGNITADVDALNDGLDLATATTGAALIKDIANYGKRAWQFVSGQTSDPKGQLLLKGAILDADTNTGGTITVEVFFLVP
jgi:hypothetical protein